MDQEIPLREVNLLHGQCGCTEQEVCQKYRSTFMKRMVGKYVTAQGKPFPGQLVSAIIDVHDFNYDEYIAKLRKIHKGNAVRDSIKAEKAGYVCKQFVWSNFIPDIVEINHSKEERCGRRMSDSYRRDVAEMGGAPQKLKVMKDPVCPVHHTYCWGIFESREGYAQGEVATGEKLLGYIKFKRNGNFAAYTQILGHGEYLKKGIMYRLHYTVMEWIAESLKKELQGLEYVLYGTIDSGGKGLQQWKKRSLFEGVYLVLNDRPANSHCQDLLPPMAGG